MILSGKNNHPPRFEKVAYSQDSSIAMDWTRGMVLDCHYHYHPEIEFTFVVSGSGRVLLGTELLPYCPGDLALIGSNIPHLYISTPEEDPKALSETRVIKIRDCFLRSGILALPEFFSIARLFQELQTVILFQNTPDFLTYFDRLDACSGSERMLLFLEFLHRLSLTSHRVLPSMEAGAPPPRTNDCELIETVIRIMQLRFREKLTLKRVAFMVGMDSESFRRFFRRTVRVSFSGYLIDLRLTYAGKLLRESKKNISEIAWESGFANLSNFNRLFLARHQLTPREYRKLH